MKEVKLHQVAGPFKQVPYVNYMQSPIGLVPKDSGTQMQLIFHLSYDFKDGKSVNFHTPSDWCSVKYHDLDYAISAIWDMSREGKEMIYFSKTDGKSAFHILPLSREFRKWVIMMAFHPVTGEKWYFVDKCLPFGASISCAYFQHVSDGIKFIFEFEVGYHNFVSNYLDDFPIFALLLTECNRLMLLF